ncbi:hypothetical protein ACBR55_11990 [Salinicoccus roseus]|uniref:hypothetical protein n=1 Tax=Salinicoccus roseus TaxID=45670 RepID=UPI0035248639
MKETFIFEFLKLLSTIIITFLMSKLFVGPLSNINPDLLSISVLILGFSIYYFLKFLIDIFRPITLEVSQKNHTNPNPEETHIVVDSYGSNGADMESSIIIEIRINYLSVFSKPIILYLFNKCKLSLQFQTANNKVYIRGNNYSIFTVDTQIGNGVNFNISERVINIINVNDNVSTNGEKYKLYVRTKPLEEAEAVEANININLVSQESASRVDWLLKFILVNSIKKSFSTHKIHYYKRGV